MKDIDIKQLQLPASAYEHLTYPRMRPFLLSAENAKKLIVVAASHAGRPVALLLLSDNYKGIRSGSNIRRLLSIMVHTDYRRQGLAERLLSMAQTLAEQSGTQTLDAFHSDRMRQPEPYLGLLAKDSWDTPELLEYRLSGYADWSQEAEQDWPRFFQRIRRNGFNTLPWHELDARQYASVEALCESLQMKRQESLCPFRWKENTDPVLSVALLKGVEVVGWIFAEWDAAENTAHYTCGFVKPGLQKTGWLIAGIAEVCHRQRQVYGAKSVAIFETLGNNLAMQRFMKQRLRERWSLNTDHRYRSRKFLRPHEQD